MKISKKLVSVLLVLTMLAALSVSVFAADPTTYTITISNTATGHTYEAYQIFAGDLSGTSPNYVLSNITWGSGVTADGQKKLGDAAAKAASLTADNVAAFATEVSGYLQNPTSTNTMTADAYTITVNAPGYYLIKDLDGSQTSSGTNTATDTAYTKYIVRVVGPTTVEPKASVPSVIKKVEENTKSVTGDTAPIDTHYNDVADYSIGDDVPFELIGTLPTNYADYTAYNYVFHDTASAGLTIKEGTVKIYINDEEMTSEQKTASGCMINHDGQNLTVSFTNLKKIDSITKDSVIKVKYDATLNSNAKIGSAEGNPNEVYLTYSNNPNNSGEGTTDHGKTPIDKVIVFTYELDTTKVDGSDTTKTLAKAEFELYKTVDGTNNYAVVADGKVTGWTTDETAATKLVSGSDGLFKVAGLDDGTYYLKETKAPTGYNLLADPVTLVIAATTVNSQNWVGTAADALTALTIKVGSEAIADGNVSTGTVTATIANNAGSTLPSTGGIGTTLFYVIGILLMSGAAVLLVTKKKMANREN
jgi:fimbrial isopeptide formation D2 family protein/LPXTG-motif cell wall-anchored protein